MCNHSEYEVTQNHIRMAMKVVALTIFPYILVNGHKTVVIFLPAFEATQYGEIKYLEEVKSR